MLTLATHVRHKLRRGPIEDHRLSLREPLVEGRVLDVASHEIEDVVAHRPALTPGTRANLASQTLWHVLDLQVRHEKKLAHRRRCPESGEAPGRAEDVRGGGDVAGPSSYPPNMADLRGEIELTLVQLREALTRSDLDAARRHVLHPAELRLDALGRLPPPEARFVGAAETRARWVTFGVAQTRDGVGSRVAARDLFRDRSGALRLETLSVAFVSATSDDDDALRSEFAKLVAQRSGVATRAAARVTHAAPPDQPCRISDILWLGLAAPPYDPDAPRALAADIGGELPKGYARYVQRFGEAIECNLVRVHTAAQIREELDDFRLGMDAYWHWAPSEDGLDRDQIVECVRLADTLDGDQLVFHPQRPGRTYVLPRNANDVITLPGGLASALAWLCESGDLNAPCPVRYAEPLRGAVHRKYRERKARWFEFGGQRPPDEARTRDAICTAFPGSPTIAHDDDDGGTTVLVAAIGGTAFVFGGGTAHVHHDPAAPTATLDALDGALRAAGLEPIAAR